MSRSCVSDKAYELHVGMVNFTTKLVSVQARSLSNILNYSFSDIFKTGQWNSSWTTANRDLLPLADQLPDICLSAKAPNTRKKYKYTFKNFRKLCISHNVSFCPSSDFHVALYLIHLKNLGKVTGSIDEAFNLSAGLINWQDCWTPVTQILQKPPEKDVAGESVVMCVIKNYLLRLPF